MVPRRFVRRRASPYGHVSGYSPATAANSARLRSGAIRRSLFVQSTSIIGVEGPSTSAKADGIRGVTPPKGAPAEADDPIHGSAGALRWKRDRICRTGERRQAEVFGY